MKISITFPTTKQQLGHADRFLHAFTHVEVYQGETQNLFSDSTPKRGVTPLLKKISLDQSQRKMRSDLFAEMKLFSDIE